VPTAKKPHLAECQMPDCAKPAKKKGVCMEHFEGGYALCCTIDGCTEATFAKGRCRAHYMRRYRKKIGKPSPPPDKPIRSYGQERFEVFTRIPKEIADVLLKKAGRRDGMYEIAQTILVDWAERHAG
jgi:hypothetical protein